jgi:hypothetical protein
VLQFVFLLTNKGIEAALHAINVALWMEKQKNEVNNEF